MRKPIEIQHSQDFVPYRRFKRIGYGVLFLCLVSAASTALTAASATAQTADRVQGELVRELERLRRDLSDMQRFVYRGEKPSRPANAPSQASGDTEAAARLQRQLLEMQTQLRELTGHIERVQYDLRQVGERLDKLVADVDIRLRALESGPLPPGDRRLGAAQGRTPSQQTALRPPVGTTIISSGGISDARNPSEPSLPPGQKSLGQISEKDLAGFQRGQPVKPAQPASPAPVAVQPSPQPPAARPAPAPQGVTSSVASVARPLGAGELPEGTARQQYEFAFGKLKQRDYDGAESALRAFVDRHPDGPLAGNAMYWMGETYYVRKQYPEAARIFLDAYQRFPKGNKAPDNLFKLAKSLVQIGETASACTTYTELVKTFPNANRRILSGAQSDIQRLGCS